MFIFYKVCTINLFHYYVINFLFDHDSLSVAMTIYLWRKYKDNWNIPLSDILKYKMLEKQKKKYFEHMKYK